MFTRFTAYSGGLAVIAMLLGTSAGAASTTTWPHCLAPTGGAPRAVRSKLQVKACGPARVIRGVNYSYTILLTNLGTTTFRGVELSVTHNEPITRSSLPYRRRHTERSGLDSGPSQSG